MGSTMLLMFGRDAQEIIAADRKRERDACIPGSGRDTKK